MTQAEFLGMFIITLGAFLGVLATIATFLSRYITKPINLLNESIIRLTASVESDRNNLIRIDKRVDVHGKRIDEHDIILARNNLK